MAVRRIELNILNMCRTEQTAGWVALMQAVVYQLDTDKLQPIVRYSKICLRSLYDHRSE